jgi:glycosyltransferase involved in cell wall biosynthesis
MSDTSFPRVSVVTATYNGARFLPAAIESILAQRYTDFEYVIVDDASTDASAAIATDYAAQDNRVCLVTNPVRLGPPGALNRALAAVQGDYVAVLDHDDLALPERLARQVAFLDEQPAVGAVGAKVRFIDEAGIVSSEQAYPTHPAVARWQLLFGASLLHSASMYRRGLLQQLGGYSEEHPYLCDYELLGRLAEISQIVNLPDLLTCYRRSSTQVSATHRTPQLGQMILLQYAIQQRWLGLRPDLAAFSALHRWMKDAPPSDAAQATAAVAQFEALYDRYGAVVSLSADAQTVVAQTCARQWLALAHHAYTTQRAASRVCWRNACRLDAQVLRRAETLAWLRRHALRRQKTPQPSIA